MKTLMKLIVLMVFVPGWFFHNEALGDPPSNPPPPPGGGHGGGSNQPPAGAPIDGGLGMLLILGTTVGMLKFYQHKTDGRENN
jgi:hypothetical protein